MRLLGQALKKGQEAGVRDQGGRDKYYLLASKAEPDIGSPAETRKFLFAYW